MPMLRSLKATWASRYSAAPPASAVAVGQLSGSPTWASVVFIPSATRTIAATIGRWRYENASRASALRSLSDSTSASRRADIERGDVEVRPPERARNRDAEDRGDDDTTVDPGFSSHADRHDRLAQGDDHDQAVAFGEVACDEPPTAGVDEQRAGHVEHERSRPHRAPRLPVEERADDQDADPDRRADRETGDRLSKPGVVPAGEDEQRDVRGPHRAVGERERQTQITERVWHAQ